MNKTIGILAHVDAGKTTFSEQLLYHTKSIRQRGRVDHKDAFLDSHEIERQRGITVFADQGMFTYQDSTYYLIDTPGHVDFSPEMERAIQVMDYAVIIISAVEGIEGHTETVWELLRKYEVPTFFFINKVDRIGADAQRVLNDIRKNLSSEIVDLTNSLHNGTMTEELIEFVAERDEVLLDYYMEYGYNQQKWLKKLQHMVATNKVFACASGSALQDIGIDTYLEAFHQLTLTNYQVDAPFSGRVYKIRHEQNGTKLTYMKALSGKIKVRDEITYRGKTEKITQIRVYNGEKYKIVDEVRAGELFTVTGLSSASIGDGLGELEDTIPYEMIPTLRSNVLFEPSISTKEVLKYFKLLNAEDPSLNVIWEESLQQIHIHVMGKIQLEVLAQIIYERFHLKITFAEPEIIYKETIQSEVVGYGHFEPLGHYAEVHLKIEPSSRSSGITFENTCHADDLSIGHQNLIRHHFYEREHHGILTGSALTDIKVTLLTGRAHNKHTSGGDFREATYRAIRQGFEKAENILLEPIYQFKIKVNLDQVGRVLTDIQKAHGRFEAPFSEGDKTIIMGTAPVSTFMNYPSELAAYTQGKGSITLKYAGYDICHNQEEIVAKIGYNKDADPDYTSSSIFCSKGQGYSVRWDEAEQEMHALK